MSTNPGKKPNVNSMETNPTSMSTEKPKEELCPNCDHEMRYHGLGVCIVKPCKCSKRNGVFLDTPKPAESKAGSEPVTTPNPQPLGNASGEWLEDKKMVRIIRAEIWRLVHLAKDMETVHWLVALDNCFENDEFDYDQIGNLKYRLDVLDMRKIPLLHLIGLLREALPEDKFEQLRKYDPFDTSKWPHEASSSNNGLGGQK